MRLAAFLLVLSGVMPLWAEDGYTVAGTVVHSLTRAPLAKARLLLVASRSKDQPISVVTGADGRFQFTRVPAGKYTLSAERNGFNPQAYNQRRLFQRYSSAVVTGPAENTSDLVFAMVPGAVVSGNVKDVNGDPVPWARGTLYRISGFGANRSAQRVSATTTDDQGSFRFVSLSAGRYVLAMQGKPWYAVSAWNSAADLPAYPLTFYPAATDPAAAEFIVLAAGEEFQARVVMSAVPTYSVIVKRPTYATGQNAYVAFGGPAVYGASSFSAESQYFHEESIQLRLPAGRYQVMISEAQQPVVGIRDVEIVQNNQEIEFDKSPSASVSGFMEVMGSRAKLGPQPVIRMIRDGADTGAMRAVEPDGKFRMVGVPAGGHRVSLNTPAPHVIRSISAKGAVVREGLVVIPPTGEVELNLVVDTEVAEIEGRLTSDGRGVSGALVAVTPKGRLSDVWLHRMDQTDSDGSFSLRGVTPGEYLAYVFPEGDEILAADPNYLKGFTESAIPFTIEGIGKQKLNLTLPKP